MSRIVNILNIPVYNEHDGSIVQSYKHAQSCGLFQAISLSFDFSGEEPFCIVSFLDERWDRAVQDKVVVEDWEGWYQSTEAIMGIPPYLFPYSGCISSHMFIVAGCFEESVQAYLEEMSEFDVISPWDISREKGEEHEQMLTEPGWQNELAQMLRRI